MAEVQMNLIPSQMEKMIKVTQRIEYDSFIELYKDFTPVEMGYDEGEHAYPDDMLEVYTKEDVQTFGVVGFYLRSLMNRYR